MFQRTSSGVRSIYLNELFADFAQISNISFGNALVDTVACNKIIERSTGQGVQIAGGLIINGIAFFNGINLPNLPTQHYIGIDNDGYITHAINSPNLASIDQNLGKTSSPRFSGLTIDDTTENTYIIVNGEKKITSASNSSNLASIDQNLGKSSTVTFAKIELPGDGYIKFRDDYPGEFNYGIHWRSTSWDLRVFIDKDTVSERGVSFGHYEDNDMNKTWNEYVKIKNNGTISLNGLTANTVLSLDANKSVISEVRGSAFNKNFGHGQHDVPRGWWLSSGSYTPTIYVAFNVSGATFNSAYYCRMHKIIHIHASVSIAASAQSDVAWISFDVPVLDAFTSEYQANGMAVAQTVNGQESHPARVFASENNRVRMSWWSTTTDTVRWSVLISVFDTGDV